MSLDQERRLEEVCSAAREAKETWHYPCMLTIARTSIRAITNKEDRFVTRRVMMTHNRIRLALLVLLLNAVGPACPGKAEFILRTQEKPLAKVPATADLLKFQISQDQRHVA